MAGFTGAGIEDLAYDFTKWIPEADPEIGYTPGKHRIPEPTDLQITAYFGAIGSMLRSNGAKLDHFQHRLTEAAEARNEDLRYEIEDEFEKWERDNRAKGRAERLQLVANLCSNEPNAEVLDRLPGRIFDAFTEYLQDELTGKDRRSATTS
jgi:hypothetical protein